LKYESFFTLYIIKDFHGSWENYTDHNTPLYPRSNEQGDSRCYNVDWAVNYWISKGAPREKLVLGLATYGRSFNLTDTNQHREGSLAYGAGIAGKYTREPGFLSFYEICEKLSLEGWQRVWNNEQKVPYAYKDNQWVSYEDIESLKLKVYFKISFCY